jgi:DNA-binding PadR family transcriptional regulator
MEENEITYHAVEKDGVVTAIWEMQGRKHLRTIDPRSEEGRRILGAYTTDEIEHSHAAEHGEATP